MYPTLSNLNAIAIALCSVKDIATRSPKAIAIKAYKVARYLAEFYDLGGIPDNIDEEDR